MEGITAFSFWELITAVLTALSLLMAVAAFFINERRRIAIDAAMRGAPGRRRLGMFDLAHGDVSANLSQRHLTVPERLWTYDNFYLDRFAKAASAVRLPDQRTALATYVGPTLGWDIVFAAGLGLFIAFLEFGAATVLLPYPLLSGFLSFCAAMGVVYGAADIAEDLKLASILKDWESAQEREKPKKIHIDGGEAAAANALTRIKIVAITLSVVGILVFVVLSGIGAVVYGRPHGPTSASHQGDLPTATG